LGFLGPNPTPGRKIFSFARNYKIKTMSVAPRFLGKKRLQKGGKEYYRGVRGLSLGRKIKAGTIGLFSREYDKKGLEKNVVIGNLLGRGEAQ